MDKREGRWLGDCVEAPGIREFEIGRLSTAGIVQNRPGSGKEINRTYSHRKQ